MDRLDCIDKINRLIPSKDVRNCIFRGDDQYEDEFLCNKRSVLIYFSNIINVAFLYIYMHYRKWKETDNNIDSKCANNFVRVFSELNKIYKDSNLSFDIIESLLVDIQLDIAIDGQLSRELKLTNKIIKNENFSRYAYIAKKARNSFRTNDNLDLATLYEYLVDLITTFPFLRDLSFTKVEIENAYFVDQGSNQKNSISGLYNIVLQYDNLLSRDESYYDKDLDTNNILIMRDDAFYYLERIETFTDDSGKSTLYLSYWQIGMFANSLPVYISSEEDFSLENPSDAVIIQYETAFEDYSYTIMDYDFSSQVKSAEGFRIKNFYNINYKYIKNLALSISDVVTETVKSTLTSTYGTKYSFKLQDEIGSSNVVLSRGVDEFIYSWSEIITLLMVEEGTTNILAFLIKTDRDLFNKLLSNLEFRFGKSQFDQKAISEDVSTTMLEFDKHIKLSNEITESNKRAYNRELADSYAEIVANKIVFYISKAVNGNEIKEFKLQFPISIRSKILLLEEIKNSDLEFSVKTDSVKFIVFNTIKSLYCFYAGFFAYASVKKEFDNESFYRCLTTEEIEKYQEQASKAFSKAVRKCNLELEDFDSKDVVGIIKIFKKFCLSCENNLKNGDKLQLLKTALGKSKIIDVSMLDRLTDMFQYAGDEEDVEVVIANIKTIFNYLMTGKSKKSNVSLGTIFPYVATCEYTDINRDGNIIYHFSIISSKGQEKSLRVLSEFKYELNKKYYFLPNKLCSDENLNLWIEPVIIDFENFDLQDKESDCYEI